MHLSRALSRYSSSLPSSLLKPRSFFAQSSCPLLSTKHVLIIPTTTPTTTKTSAGSSRKRWLTTTSGDGSSGVTQQEPHGEFIHAVSFLPHPEKDEFGEDAYFISDNNQLCGVADGVGGWIEMGIDAGAFSRELMSNAKKFASDENSLIPGDILASAYFSTTAMGTCTACIIALEGSEMRAINVGDSGFSIFRRQPGENNKNRSAAELNDDPPKWGLYFETSEQTHFFNCPYQLGTNSRDSPADGQQFTLPMEHGDLVILATDGVIDNIFTAELIQVRYLV